jgi:RNA polymerase sigma-70 factor (ECF subfamily)
MTSVAQRDASLRAPDRAAATVGVQADGAAAIRRSRRQADAVHDVGTGARAVLARRTGRRVSLRGASDAVLVRAAQAGSDEAVEALFARHWPDAYRAAYLIARDRAAAEDIAQEAFLAAVRALGRFDRRRPLRPWLHRIVVNRAIDWSRARALRQEVDVDGVPELPAGHAAPSELLDSEIAAALAALSPEQRAVVVLRYLLEFTPGEIATALDLPRGTVNSRLRRGLDALGGALGDEPR